MNTEGACVFLNYGFLRGHAMIGKETGPSVEMWMDLRPVMQSEVSQKQENKYHMLMRICEV